MAVAVGHVRISEFTEEDFVSAFELMLNRSTYRGSFLEISRISHHVERDLGYDGILTSIVPLYIQFKRSYFHLPAFGGATATDRKAKNLSTNYGYYSFHLHRDKKTKAYDQHNALWRLSHYQRAIYVAPLFVRQMQLSYFKALPPSYPWSFGDISVHDAVFAEPIHFRNTRMFSRCITIVPHREIADRAVSHEYTFTQTGELCFHSEPERPETPVYLFAEYLLRMLGEQYEAAKQGASNLWLIKVLPELYHSSWQAGPFRSMVKAYLIELGLYPERAHPGVLQFVQETLSNSQRYLLAELMLQRDFGITQLLLSRSDF